MGQFDISNRTKIIVNGRFYSPTVFLPFDAENLYKHPEFNQLHLHPCDIQRLGFVQLNYLN